MGHKPNKNQPPDNRDPSGCAETASETADPGSLPGEISHPSLKSRMRNARTVLIICGFLLLAVALVFGRTLGYEFVDYDDGQYVYENPQVAGGLSARGIVWAFTAGHASNWHPLTWISHMVDSQIYGLHAGGHHLTSVLLHAAVAILLFLVLLRMTGELWSSAFVAAVFAVHPLRVESVAWVSERKDVLSGLFFVLTLWAYVGYARRPFLIGRYLTVAVLFALGLMSKPMLVTLPFVLLLLDYWPLGRIELPEKGKSFPFSRRVIVEKLPLLALTAVSCVVTFVVQHKAVVPIDTIPMSSRIANALVSIVAYLGDLFYPVGLAVLYPHPGSSLPIWNVVGSLMSLAGITTAAIVWRRRLPYLFVGWFWYVGMMVPVIGVVQVGFHAMADRYTYLPQIGLCIALTWGVAQLAASWRHRRRVLGVAAALAVLVLMAVAWRQSSYWRDSETLWTHALACTARNYIAHNNLGDVLARHGQADAAVAHFQRALEIKPGYADAHYNLGTVLEGRGQVDAAITRYQRALEIKPDFAEAHSNLGNVLERYGQVEDAIAHYQKALEIKPRLVEAHYNLGNALAGRGQMEDAIAHYRQALDIRPDYAAVHNNLGILMAGSGQMEDAIAHYRKALESDPYLAEAHSNLGNALEKRGQVDAALAHYQKAIEIKPDYVAAHNNLGILLAGRGQVDAAIDHYRKVLEIKPDHAAAHNNLGIALAGRREVDAAIVHYRKALELKPDFTEARNNLNLALGQRGQGNAGDTHYRKALEPKPDQAKSHYSRGMVLHRQGKIADAVIQWREAIRLQPDNIIFLNQLAWVLATCPEGSIRNGTEAIDLARRAVRLSGGREPAILDTLAAAYAEAGRFSEAVEAVEQAVSLASARKDTALVDIIRTRIKLYRARSPYREARPQASGVN